MTKRKKSIKKGQEKSVKPKCGLCGKTTNLTKTECCGQWICDDEDQYVPFSYARNSCYRNHRLYTLCGYHYAEGHPGDWKPVLSVGMILKPRCMCIMVLMNIILKNWKILRIMSQQDVQSVIP